MESLFEVEETRVCTKCGERKNLHKFYAQSYRSKKGNVTRRNDCKECVNSITRRRYVDFTKEHRRQNKDHYDAYRRKYYNEHKQEYRHGHRLRKYGIRKEEFLKILDSQKWKCKICSVLMTDEQGSNCVSVDHCHTSGHVRGLICNLCNLAEGSIRTAENALNLYNYMKQNELFDGRK